MNNLTKKPIYIYILILTLCATGGLQTWRILFDNFAVRIIHLDGHHIGIIQSIREVPGFLAFTVIYILFLVREQRFAAFSVLLLGLGVLITGLFPSFQGLIFTTLVMSFGFHYFETCNQSLTLQHFSHEQAPLVFGRLRAYASLCNIVVSIFFLLIAPYFTYTTLYLFLGSLIIIITLFNLKQHTVTDSPVPQRKEMIFKKQYWLFYLLTFLSGARRQIFIAFAVFLLVKKFSFSIQEIAVLFLINNVINYFLSPFIGKCIVKFGERKVLSLEYTALIFVFLGYALVEDRYIAALLYVFDHIFFNFAIAIRTFFQKIANPADIAPSMAVGFTINHIAAVVLPVLGGILWLIDYRIPFLIGAVISIVSLLSVQSITAQLAAKKRTQ
jgi:hypothetical protein